MLHESALLNALCCEGVEERMHWTYSCPHCDAALNPEVSIVLRAEHEDTEVSGGSAPATGQLRGRCCRRRDHAAGHPGSSVARSAITLWSPSSQTSSAPSICVRTVNATGSFFSRIAGEEATFVVSAEGMLTDHGVHTDKYLEHMVHRKYMR